jgi:hypothetical protein
MSKFHEVGGRKGYFLVVSEGGTESDCLTPEYANSEADGIRGPKAIWWQYLDEQPSKEKDGRDWILIAGAARIPDVGLKARKGP